MNQRLENEIAVAVRLILYLSGLPMGPELKNEGSATNQHF